MRVIVKQRKISFFGESYIVYCQEQKILRIKKNWLSLMPQYSIFDYVSKQLVGNVKNQKISLSANALITLDNVNYVFKQIAFNQMKYSCYKQGDENNQYSIIAHEGFESSIYYNENQIGKWVKNEFVILEGDIYNIDIDYDANVILIAAMTVLVDRFRFGVRIGGDIGWELGNMGKGLKRYKSNWKPKEES